MYGICLLGLGVCRNPTICIYPPPHRRTRNTAASGRGGCRCYSRAGTSREVSSCTRRSQAVRVYTAILVYSKLTVFLHAVLVFCNTVCCFATPVYRYVACEKYEIEHGINSINQPFLGGEYFVPFVFTKCFRVFSCEKRSQWLWGDGALRLSLCDRLLLSYTLQR